MQQQSHSQQYSQQGLAMDSLYLNAVCMGFMRLAEYDVAICMGFMRLAECDVAICMGFKGVPLKTHANTSRSSKQLLKTHSKCINKQRSSLRISIKSC